MNRTASPQPVPHAGARVRELPMRLEKLLLADSLRRGISG